MLSVALTLFQLASTALTVRLKEVPADCVVGVPVRPMVLPGNDDSPGASTSSLAKDPGFTVTAALVFGDLLPSVISDAVTVEVPAAFKVTLKFFTPPARFALAGSVAKASLEVMPTL